jgi:hypothetical protein
MQMMDLGERAIPSPAMRLEDRGRHAFAQLDARGVVPGDPTIQDTLWRMGAIPARTSKVPTKPGTHEWMAQRAGTLVGHFLASGAHADGGPDEVRRLLARLFTAAPPADPVTGQPITGSTARYSAALLQGAAMSVHGLEAMPPAAGAPDLPVVGLEIERSLARAREALQAVQPRDPAHATARVEDGVALARTVGALEDAANQKAEAGLRYRIGRYGFMTTWETLGESAAAPVGPRQLVRQASRAFRRRQLALYATGTLPVGDLAQRQRTEYDLLSNHVHGIIEISLSTADGLGGMTQGRADQAARIARAKDLPPMLRDIVDARTASRPVRRTVRRGKGWDGATLDLFGAAEQSVVPPSTVRQPAIPLRQAGGTRR